MDVVANSVGIPPKGLDKWKVKSELSQGALYHGLCRNVILGYFELGGVKCHMVVAEGMHRIVEVDELPKVVKSGNLQPLPFSGEWRETQVAATNVERTTANMMVLCQMP